MVIKNILYFTTNLFWFKISNDKASKYLNKIISNYALICLKYNLSI